MVRNAAGLPAATMLAPGVPAPLPGAISREQHPEAQLVSPRRPCLDICETFVADILRPYRGNAKYLESARLTHIRHLLPGNANEVALMRGIGKFAIPESCYSREDGFGAPEFNICFNQLAYVLFGKCIEAGALEDLTFLTFAEYKRHQLPSWLIASIASRYFGPLDSDDFHGELTLDRTALRGRSWFFFTRIAFFDEQGLKAEGSVVLAFQPAQRSETAQRSVPCSSN